MSELLVRPAREDELAEIGALTVEAYVADRHMPPGHPYGAQLADTARRAKETEILVAVDQDDTVLGTVTIVPPGTSYSELAGPGELEFRMLAARPTARGRGVGAALVTAVLDHARSHGYRRVVLSSLDRMRAAHRVYERFGFRRAPERDWRPEGRATLWAFTLDLAADGC